MPIVAAATLDMTSAAEAAKSRVGGCSGMAKF
jgi:hypothetical protein